MSLRVPFDLMVFSDKILLQFGHLIESHLGVILKVIYINISVSFHLCLDERLIEFWGNDIMFQIPHNTNLLIFTTLQWWTFPYGVYHCGRILGLVCFRLFGLWVDKIIHEISVYFFLCQVYHSFLYICCHQFSCCRKCRLT